MIRRHFIGRMVVVVAVVLGMGRWGWGKEVSMRSLLGDMTDLGEMARFPEPAYVTKQFSSYDRGSKTADDAKGWFANNDCGQYLRVEDVKGHKEYVMADMQGPGAIVRIWSPNPGGTMRIYIDGAEKPAVEWAMADLLAGKHPLLPPPIAANLSMGWNLYLPMPYAKSCKVTCDKGGQYYHVNYRTYPAGTAVTSFTVGQLEEAKAELAGLAQRLASPRGFVAVQPRMNEAFGVSVEPGKTVSVAKLSGMGAIGEFVARVDVPESQRDAALRGVIVKMTFDGEQTVEAPLGDFFGSAPGINVYTSVPLGVEKDGTMYCHWVMPYKEGAEVTLTNLGPAAVNVKGSVSSGAWTWDERSMHFHAKWKGQFDVSSRPMFDWNYLTASGKGVFGGVAFFIDNPVKDWWGEGDEKIYVDGETFPSHFGTGTEDYYGYGWCCPQLFSHAYHNQPRCDGPANFGRTSVNRFHILDRIPFTQSFRFDMELWHWKECKVNMAVTAYYYGLPGAQDTFKPITAQEAVVRPAPELVVMRVPGAIEGERMRIIRKTGTPGPQEWDGTSGGAQLWWHGGQKVGDELALAFKVERAGKYPVYGRFLKAVDYGVMQISINGQPAGQPIDFYNDGVVATDEVLLGTFELKAGENEVTVKVVGANEKAKKEYMFGLDYLKVAVPNN